LRQDPASPSCLWEVGDVGIMQVFSKNTGGTCADSQADVTVKPAAFYCDGGAHTTTWTSINIEGVTAANYTSAQVSVFDSAGNIVPGFDAITVPNTQQSIPLTGIGTGGATSQLTAIVTLIGLNPAVSPPDLTLGFSGDPMQVCFQTTVPLACPTAGATVSNTATAVTVGVDGTSDGPAGNSSGAATFTNATSGACGLAAAKVLASVTGPNGTVPFVGQPVNPGDVLLFQITVTNSGLVADSTTLTETVGAGLSYTGTGEGWTSGCTTAGTTCTQVVSVPGGGSVTVNFTETVDNPLPGGTTSLTNTLASSNGTVTTGTVTIPVNPVPLVGSLSVAAFFVLLGGGAGFLRVRRRRSGGVSRA
jgi:hypothetical protein